MSLLITLRAPAPKGMCYVRTLDGLWHLTELYGTFGVLIVTGTTGKDKEYLPYLITHAPSSGYVQRFKSLRKALKAAQLWACLDWSPWDAYDPLTHMGFPALEVRQAMVKAMNDTGLWTGLTEPRV